MMAWVRIRFPYQPVVFLTIVLSGLGAVLIGAFMAFARTTELPLLGDKSNAFAVIVVPALTLVILSFVRADVGFGLMLGAATLLIAQTGMQLDIGDLRTSALEVLILAATFILALRTRIIDTPPRWERTLLDRPLILFAFLGIPSLVLALAGGVSPVNIITELKGYFLYPLLVYVMVAWIRTPRRWRWLALLGVAGALVVAVAGIMNWRQGNLIQVNSATVLVERVSGIFGVINQYGFYLSSMALVAMGLLLATRKWYLFGLAAISVIVMLVGMSVSGSRGAFIGLTAGSGVMILLQYRRFRVWLPFLLVGVGLLIWQLPNIEDRVAATSGSESQRVTYFWTGLEVLKNYPIFGAGWGASFWLANNNVLVQAEGLPWLHNDYMNLLTQVGLIAMLPFLWLWWRVLKAGFLHVRNNRSPELTTLLSGILAGLVALLVEAATDHVFWRPDIAGQVWWLTGMLLAGIKLIDLQTSDEASGRS